MNKEQKIKFFDIKNFILNILFPVECLGCSRDDYWLCEDCQKKLKYNQNYFIEKSAFSCLDGAFVVFDYNNKLVEKLIKNFKYKFIKDIGDTLGSLASSFLENKQDKINLNNIIIIPVPLHKKRLNWRGFNQAEEVAKIIANNINHPFLNTQDLVKIKNTQPQAKLDRELRKINIKNSFSWQGKNLKGKTILLIDDVMTTGSTLDECAYTLKNAGALRVYSLVIAHG